MLSLAPQFGIAASPPNYFCWRWRTVEVAKRPHRSGRTFYTYDTVKPTRTLQGVRLQPAAVAFRPPHYRPKPAPPSWDRGATGP